MIRTNEIRTGLKQIQYSLATLDETRLQRRAIAANHHVKTVQRAVTREEINLSVSQILSGLIFSVCVVGLITWGALRYWLFAR
jgi:hypothetical protein